VQRTVRFLRVALPIAGILFIVVLAASWKRGGARRDNSGNTTVTSDIRPIDKPQLESKTFEDTQTIGGRVVSRIRANRVVAFVSGWNTLEGVSMTIYRPTGLTYELVCPEAQFNSETKEADAKGGVRVVSSDGVEITTAQIHFDGNRLTNHIPVQFKVDRWTGNAGALDLDVKEESLHLFEKVDATMVPADPAQSQMTLKAQDGMFRRKENVADFNKDVVLTRDADRLAADHIAAHLAADRKTLTALQGEGKPVNIVLEDGSSVANALPAKGSDTGRKEITCDRFWSEVGATGQINAIVMAGDTAPAHAVIDGPPKRDLVAKTLRAGLANKVVTDVKADVQVAMKELGPIPRDLTAEHVTVYFNGATHKAISAVIEDNMHYHDPRNDARAERANYDIVNDRVVLTAQPGFDPAVVTDGNIVKAKLIEFSPRAGTAKATTSVIAQLTSKQSGPSADSTNVFPTNKPVFVNSDQLSLRQADKIAVFSGHVRAWQETNTIFANEMQATGAGDQITAHGDVRTILYNTPADKAARPTPMRSRSDDLIARKNERRIDLSGSVALDDDQRHMQGDKAAFFFDASHHIERVDADGHVVLIEPAAQRKGTGDKMTYLVPKHMIYVSGDPATMTAPTGTVQGQRIALDTLRNKVEIVSPSEPTKGTYKQQPSSGH